MTDLRKAAEMALEAMEKYCECGGLEDPIEALRQALAQPEQDYEVTHNDDGTFSVSLPEGDELRIVPPKKKWVGLTSEDKAWAQVLNEPYDISEKAYLYLEAKLKDKNT